MMTPVEEDIYHRFARLEMTALDERCLRAEFDDQFLRRARHPFLIEDLLSEEERCFVEIRRDDGTERDQLVSYYRDGVPLEEQVTRAGDHHWIENETGEGMVNDGRDHRAHDLGAAEHSRLERIGAEVGRNGIDLRPDKRGGHGLPCRDPECILRCYGRNYGRAEDAVSLKRLQVGLNSSAAPGIGPGNRECNVH